MISQCVFWKLQVQYFIVSINYHLYYSQLKSQSGSARPVKLDCHESQEIVRGLWSPPSQSVQLLGGKIDSTPLRKWGYRFGRPRVEEKGVSGAKLKWLHSEKKVGWHWSGMDFSWPDRGGAQLEIRGRGAWGSVLSWHCHDHDHDHQEFGVAGGEVPGLF